ncbi:MAG: tRNA (adenosine(37)-N6)-threonylcarbamoyltransferase complex transferase subunit TsaD [Planctomycetota bacterium]|jgi:N6-L-threonylcarbamoyladenine synthase
MTTLVLGIESSCDETAAAVVRDGDRVLSNIVHSQVQLHGKYHGVVPEIASRSHTTRILPVIQAALADAKVQPDDLGAVAVTNRPGMVGCLLVGTSAAKALSWLYQLPLIGVDHIQAHIHAGFMTDPDMALPGLALVASGGHTALYLVHGPGAAERIGTTRDDAAGEALDKGAAILGLPYPGGPSIQEAARGGWPDAVALPRPLKDRRRGEGALDFSFSGIKTALLYHLRGNGLTLPMPDLSETEVRDLAASYQAAIVDCLVTKLRRALRAHGTLSLSIGGGVARNELLRERIQGDEELGSVQLVFPPPELCSDNAAMVAGLGTVLLARNEVDDLHLEVAATAGRSR